jgi:PHD/YefM family antitoxin component YafN of YafNO toxin-antitoxin module
VDDAAVLPALDSGKVYAYVCDFPTNLIKNHPRVVCLPHLGASTLEAEDNCAIMVADQVREYLENGNISNAVNFPEIVLPRNGGVRLAILNRNEPVFYCIPAKAYEELMNRLEDMELNALADSRMKDGKDPVRVALDDL